MTVKELIEKLKMMPEDAEVLQLGDGAFVKPCEVSGVMWSSLQALGAKYPNGIVGLI